MIKSLLAIKIHLNELYGSANEYPRSTRVVHSKIYDLSRYVLLCSTEIEFSLNIICKDYEK